MKLVWILLLAFSALCKEISWEEYKEKHELNFGDTEESLRRNIFEENVRKIEIENAKGHSYTLGINHFAHWTKKELKAMFMTPKKVNVVQEQKYKFEKYSADDSETSSKKGITESLNVDWRRYGYVTSVKNQGRCGSGYTFGTTGNLESARAMEGNVLEDLSPQQVLDCSGNYGCHGGIEDVSYTYLISDGSMPGSSYPYTARPGPCKYNGTAVVARPLDYERVPGYDNLFLTWSVMRRPITVRIHANVWSFIFYEGGTYNDPHCTPDVADHVVIVVGVIENEHDNYYILKNSWGNNWGMDGYMHLSKEPENLCAVTSYPTFIIMM